MILYISLFLNKAKIFYKLNFRDNNGKNIIIYRMIFLDVLINLIKSVVEYKVHNIHS